MSEEEKKEQYYFSGGLIRDFSQSTIIDVEVLMDKSVSKVSNEEMKSICLGMGTMSFTDNQDSICCSFVLDPNNILHFLYFMYQDQRIDSQCAWEYISLIGTW
jgi:hypothetical protein